jgi:hypothetical protein
MSNNSKTSLVLCLMCLLIAFLIALGLIGWSLPVLLVAAAFFWVLSSVVA